MRHQRVKEYVREMLDKSPETSCPVLEVDLGDLTEDQKIVVMEMLRDEAESFSKGDEDVGCVEDSAPPCNGQFSGAQKQKFSGPAKSRRVGITEIALSFLSDGKYILKKY